MLRVILTVTSHQRALVEDISLGYKSLVNDLLSEAECLVANPRQT